MSERNFETIVEGGYYKGKDGEVVGPAIRMDDDYFPWKVDEYSYTEDGFFYHDKRGCKYDLIARVNPDGSPWVEPVEPVEKSEPATEPEKRLPQPGEAWLTRDGLVATVKARDEASDFYGRYLSGVVLFDNGEAVARWRDDGASYSDEVHSLDLVEYIGPIKPQDKQQARPVPQPEPTSQPSIDNSTEILNCNSLKVSRVGLEVADCKNGVTVKFTESGELMMHYSKRPDLNEIASLSRCLARLHEELSKEA